MKTRTHRPTVCSWLRDHSAFSLTGSIAQQQGETGIEQLSQFSGVVQAQTVRTDQAELVERAVQRRPDGSVAKVEALYRNEGRCALVQGRPAHTDPPRCLAVNELKALLGFRSPEAPSPNSPDVIKRARMTLKGVTFSLLLVPPGAYGIFAFPMRTPLHALSFSTLFFVGAAMLMVGVGIVGLLTGAYNAHRLEPEQSVELFDAHEAKEQLRQTAPVLARKLYGRHPDYFKNSPEEKDEKPEEYFQPSE